MAQSPGHSRKLDGKVKAADNGPTITVSIGEEGKERVHTVYLNRLTGLDVGAMRDQFGLGVGGFAEWVRDAQIMRGDELDRMDPDARAAVEWLARRQAGETDLTYAEVLATATFGERVLPYDPAALADEVVEEPGDPKG